MKVLDLETIVDKISSWQLQVKKANQALLDATKINASDLGCDRSSFLDQHDQKRVNKLTPWLAKARENKTTNAKV